MSKYNCVSRDVQDKIFREYSIKIAVYLKTQNTKGDNFDPFRNLGYEITKQNPVWLQALIKDVAPNSLIYRQFGLTEAGAKQILIKKEDIPFIRLSEKITIDNINYYIYNDAVGNKLQIFELPFNYSKVIIFRKDK